MILFPPIALDIAFVNHNIFECVSLKDEHLEKLSKTGVLDYMVTVYPRNENVNNFSYVYGLFDYSPSAFGTNQSGVVQLANSMFSNSIPLGTYESTVLNKTFERLLIKNPTLSGRK